MIVCHQPTRRTFRHNAWLPIPPLRDVIAAARVDRGAAAPGEDDRCVAEHVRHVGRRRARRDRACRARRPVCRRPIRFGTTPRRSLRPCWRSIRLVDLEAITDATRTARHRRARNSGTAFAFWSRRKWFAPRPASESLDEENQSTPFHARQSLPVPVRDSRQQSQRRETSPANARRRSRPRRAGGSPRDGGRRLRARSRGADRRPSQLDAIERQHHARLRLSPSRWPIFPSVRSLTTTGVNSVGGSFAAMNGRKRCIHSVHWSRSSTRRMHSASTSADERKSSRLGSHAWQSASSWYHSIALARSRSPNTRS